MLNKCLLTKWNEFPIHAGIQAEPGGSFRAGSDLRVSSSITFFVAQITDEPATENLGGELRWGSLGSSVPGWGTEAMLETSPWWRSHPTSGESPKPQPQVLTQQDSARPSPPQLSPDFQDMSL